MEQVMRWTNEIGKITRNSWTKVWLCIYLMPVKLQLAVTWSTSSFCSGGRFSSVIWASLLVALVIVLWLVTLTNLYVSVTVLTLCDVGIAFSSFFNTVLLLCCCCCWTLNACNRREQKEEFGRPPNETNDKHVKNVISQNEQETQRRNETKSAKMMHALRRRMLDMTRKKRERASAIVLAENQIQQQQHMHSTKYRYTWLANGIRKLFECVMRIHTDILFKDKTTSISVDFFF